MQGIMASLKEEDEMVQEAALNELTELMSMSSEEALTVLPLEQLVPQLVSNSPCSSSSELQALQLHRLILVTMPSAVCRLM